MENKESKETKIKNLTRLLVEYVVATAIQDESDDESSMEQTIARMPVKSESYDCFREQCVNLKHDINEIWRLLQEGMSDLSLSK